jgi:hypothetical protein
MLTHILKRARVGPIPVAVVALDDENFINCLSRRRCFILPFSELTLANTIETSFDK